MSATVWLALVLAVEPSFVEVDGARLEYFDWGGQGEPIVLVPGGCQTARVFDEFAPRLTSHFRVLGLTTRGCGPSAVTSSEFGIDRQVDDLIALLDSLKIARATFAGHSSGGGKVIRLARRYPDRVRAIVTFDTVYREVPEAFEAKMSAAIERSVGVKVPRRSHRIGRFLRRGNSALGHRRWISSSPRGGPGRKPGRRRLWRTWRQGSTSRRASSVRRFSLWRATWTRIA